MRHALLAAVAVGAFLSASSAFAADELFKAALNGASETPPNTSHGVGMATATLDKATKTLTWKVVYSGLTGPATMAHFHGPAGPGVAAPVAVPLTGPMASPLMGSATLTDAQIGDLEAGNWYVNVHTAQYPKGEIRGQVSQAR
jgi:hypothetical protein